MRYNTRALRALLVVALALLVGACSKGSGSNPGSPSPITPGPGGQAVITPSNAICGPNGTIIFRFEGASGNINWTLPNGGGTIQALGSDAAGVPQGKVTCGSIPGTYPVRANGGNFAADCQFSVINEDYAELVDRPADGVLRVNMDYNFTVSYVLSSAEKGIILIRYLDRDGNLIPGSTGNNVVFSGSGTKTIRSAVVAISGPRTLRLELGKMEDNILVVLHSATYQVQYTVQ